MTLPLALFENLGTGEVMLIGIVALFLFGRNLPKVARNVGKAYSEFKRTVSSASSEIHKEFDAAADELEKAKPDINSVIEDAVKPTPSTPVVSHSTSNPPPALPAKSSPTDLDRPNAAHDYSSHAAPAVRAQPTLSDAAALDAPMRDIPAPTRIPPPVG